MDEKIEQLINDLEEFASDSDMNETGIYTEILDLIHSQKAEIERLAEENGWLSKACNKSTTECTELKKQVNELKQELNKATDCLVEASRCFTRMETFYKGKCKEFEIAKEKDAADSKQHCEKC